MGASIGQTPSTPSSGGASAFIGLVLAILGLIVSIYGGVVSWSLPVFLAGVGPLLTGVYALVHNYEAH